MLRCEGPLYRANPSPLRTRRCFLQSGGAERGTEPSPSAPPPDPRRGTKPKYLSARGLPTSGGRTLRSMRPRTRPSAGRPRLPGGARARAGPQGACAAATRPRPPGEPEPRRREPQSRGANRRSPRRAGDPFSPAPGLTGGRRRPGAAGGTGRQAPRAHPLLRSQTTCKSLPSRGGRGRGGGGGRLERRRGRGHDPLARAGGRAGAGRRRPSPAGGPGRAPQGSTAARTGGRRWGEEATGRACLWPAPTPRPFVVRRRRRR